jgi:hypothetical protein
MLGLGRVSEQENARKVGGEGKEKGLKTDCTQGLGGQA